MKYDIYSVQEKSTTIKIEGNSFNSLKSASIQRFGVRRFEDGKMFQVSRLGDATVDRLLADTKEWGGPGVPHEYGFAPAHSEKREGAAVSVDVVKEFEECTRSYISRHPDFVFSGGCFVSGTTVSLSSNYGLDLRASGEKCEWHLMYQRKGSGNMFDGFVTEDGFPVRIGEGLERHAEFLVAQKREAKLQSGCIPVLFANPGEPLQKLVESLMINRYHEGTCVFAGKLGTRLFSPDVTLVDQAFDPGLGQIQFFDGEGTVRASEPHVLIEKGQFKNLISDLRFGRKFGQASTGNGVRSYNTGVGLSLRSLRFAKGQKPWREILKGLDRCIVSVIAAGGDSNDLGEFSTPVQIGYVFEKGELVGRAPQLTVKTRLSDYLGKDLIAVSSDGFTPNMASGLAISEMDVMVN